VICTITRLQHCCIIISCRPS